MSKAKTEQKPRWVKREFVWFCNGCKTNKAAAPKALKLAARHFLCIDCGVKFLEKQREQSK